VFSFMRSSDVCKEAVAKAQESSRVQFALGEPIVQGMWMSGNISTVNDRGQANITIPISGPKGSGSIHAVATKANGVWTFSVLTVRVDGRKDVIDLLHASPVVLQSREQLLVYPVEAAVAKHDDDITAPCPRLESFDDRIRARLVVALAA
jgi:hypothetical protein